MTKKHFLLSLALILVLLFAAFWVQRPDGRLHVIFCDVGQGDSILIKTPSGHTLLVDGGPDDKVLSCLGGKLPFWQRSLDLAVLTHPQADHVTGLVSVARNMSVGRLLSTGIKNNIGAYRSLEELVSGGKLKREQVSAGEVINFGDGAKAVVLWPPKDLTSGWISGGTSDLNDSSVSLRFSYGQFCVVLTGDLPSKYETDVRSGHCPVLKAGHHGSKTSTSQEFLAEVSPDLVVISVGAKNRYGHPAAETLDRIKNAAARILRTDQVGTVEIVSSGDRWYIKTER